MNKDPVIERMIAVNELTKILCGKPCDICSFYGQRTKCMPVYTAEKIVDAGWRKASDVAEEIFEEIEKLTASVYNDFMFNRDGVGMNAHYVVQFSDELDLAIAELKKKYTEDGE